MFLKQHNLYNFLHRRILRVICCWIIFSTLCMQANATESLIDAFNVAPFVPLVLEIMMNMATSLYNYFVGNGTGIIYIFIYIFLGVYIALYLVKLYIPNNWLKFIGFSGGGEMWSGTATGWTITDNVLKPCFRAIIAAVVLLQIKPVYVTNWLVNPFLEFGAVYTKAILNNSTNINIPTCPDSISNTGWISTTSCNFLIQPVYKISQENNRIIKYGFDFLRNGLRGMQVMIPHGGEDILNIITGILLMVSFISSNLFMALLIIQAIFDFCLSLIMYPFNVLAWVAKKSDKWFDILPAFSQIIDALKKLVITMIACAFILCINIAVVRALFNWGSSVFVVAAGGVSNSNVPSITNSAMNFGQHSILWLSSILTVFLMQSIFKLTRDRLNLYTSGTKPTLYNNVVNDAKITWNKVKSTPKTISTIFDIGKKIVKKK